MDWLTIMLVAASGKCFRWPNSPNSWTIPGSFTPGHHCMLAILSRLNRAFFLGLNSICRRFLFIVQFSFLKTSKSQHFFQQGPIIRRQFEMPEKCAKSALQILFMFFANKIKCVACPGTLLGPQFVYMLRNWNTLYVVTSNWIRCVFCWLWPGVTDRQGGQCKVYLVPHRERCSASGFSSISQFCEVVGLAIIYKRI
jgi:hypothetical protein